MSDKPKRWQVTIEREAQIRGIVYRAELWERPYSGRMVACTDWRLSKEAAARAGRKFLRCPDAK